MKDYPRRIRGLWMPEEATARDAAVFQVAVERAAQIAEGAQRDLERLKRIERRFPRTLDKKPIYPGVTVYKIVHVRGEGSYVTSRWISSWAHAEGAALHGVYSTQEAAEAEL